MSYVLERSSALNTAAGFVADDPLHALDGLNRQPLPQSAHLSAARLFITENAVAKHINSNFTKLDLPLGVDDHRCVLAVLAWLRV